METSAGRLHLLSASSSSKLAKLSSLRTSSPWQIDTSSAHYRSKRTFHGSLQIVASKIGPAGLRCGRSDSVEKSLSASERASVWGYEDVNRHFPISNATTSSPNLAVESQSLVDFIANGVLAPKVGAAAEAVAGRLGEWSELGNQLSDFLNFSEDGLSEDEKVRIYQYYLPVFFWCQDQLATHRSHFATGESTPPVVIGINAPQGCGKTTVVEALCFLFKTTGRSTAAISVDDFYLTGTDQDKLAADNPDNGLLKFRGNAGSHDLEFGTETIKALLQLTTKGSEAKVPRYDKAARSGRGDRGDISTWPEVEGPLEVLLFEGWMLGYEPQENEAVTAVDPRLASINECLKSYYDAWHSYVNSWIIIQVGDPNWVFEWRLEAEIQMRKKGRGAMTDEQVADFVSIYMPAYKAYLPSLYSKGPKKADVDRTLKFEINKDRNPIG